MTLLRVVCLISDITPEKAMSIAYHGGKVHRVSITIQTEVPLEALVANRGRGGAQAPRPDPGPRDPRVNAENAKQPQKIVLDGLGHNIECLSHFLTLHGLFKPRFDIPQSGKKYHRHST